MKWGIMMKLIIDHFEWFQDTYHLDSRIKLEIKHYEEKEFNTFLNYEFLKSEIKLMIFFMTPSKGSKKELLDRLHHELGHVLDLNALLQKYGLERTKKKMEDYEKDVERILEELNQKKLTQKEAQNQYNHLEREKEANKYAKAINKRKPNF